MKYIGYWLSDKKYEKLKFHEFLNICKRYNDLTVVKIDLDKDIASQGPFHAILHKISDQIALANLGCDLAKSRLNNFKNYEKMHGNIVIDLTDNIRTLLCRKTLYTLMKISIDATTDNEFHPFFTPNFVEFLTTDTKANMQLLIRNNVHFPVVCKPNVAQGSKFCHKMCLIFNEEGLRHVAPPCVAQQFINHNAVLYKIFVIGSMFKVVRRPSIRDLDSDLAAESDTIFFNSHDVSKPESSSHLNGSGDHDTMHIQSYEPQIRHLITELRRILKLDLFGVDFLVENSSQNIAIIDINTFPGYDGMPNFSENLLKLVINKMEKNC